MLQKHSITWLWTQRTFDIATRESLLLGNQRDGEVQDWIQKVQVHGGVINSRIYMAGAEAIVTKV